MRIQLQRWAFACAFACGLSTAGSTFATTLLATFDNYSLGGVYGNWGDPNLTTITPHATNYEIESAGFGGGFADFGFIPPNGAGETTINLDVTVNSGNAPNVLTALQDGDGTVYTYRWYSLTPGNHPLNQPLFPINSGGFNGESYDNFLSAPGSTPGFDLSTLSFMHIQIDGPQSGYDVSFNNLQLTGAVPEPATMTMLASAALGLAWMGSRRRTH